MTNNWLSYGIIDGERSDGEPFAVTVKPGRCIMPAEKAPHGKKARRPKGCPTKWLVATRMCRMPRCTVAAG